VPAIVVADVVTKNTQHYNAADHYKNIPWWFLLCMAPLAYLSFKKPRYRLSAAIMITGAFMNYLDSLDGLVINPFIIIVQTLGVGFNIADLAIIAGFVLGFIEAIKERRSKKQLRIGSAEWSNV
jgi:lipoprotein signal peptidase